MRSLSAGQEEGAGGKRIINAKTSMLLLPILLWQKEHIIMKVVLPWQTFENHILHSSLCVNCACMVRLPTAHTSILALQTLKWGPFCECFPKKCSAVLQLQNSMLFILRTGTLVLSLWCMYCALSAGRPVLMKCCLWTR